MKKVKEEVKKVIRKEFRPAIEQLIAFYKKYPGVTVAAAKYDDVHACPLCKVEEDVREELNRNYLVTYTKCCDICPWVVMTGHCCHGYYMTLPTEERIAQLESWLTYVED